MRFKVEENRYGWYIVDTDAKGNEPLDFWVSKAFPDAKFMADSQCLFLNESPAMKAA